MAETRDQERSRMVRLLTDLWAEGAAQGWSAPFRLTEQALVQMADQFIAAGVVPKRSGVIDELSHRGG